MAHRVFALLVRVPALTCTVVDRNSSRDRPRLQFFVIRCEACGDVEPRTPHQRQLVPYLDAHSNRRAFCTGFVLSAMKNPT